MVDNTARIPTPAAEWKGKVEVDGTDLLLPSRNVARVKRLSPEAFLASGMIPDPLTAIVTKAINSKKGMAPAKELADMTKDPKKIQSALQLFDRVTAHCVVLPDVQMPPTCVVCKQYYNVDLRHSDEGAPNYHPYKEGDRDPAVLYADQVELEDKTFIFQWSLGGTTDLTEFREEQQRTVGSLSDG